MAQEALTAALWSARTSGLSWADLSLASGLKEDTVKGRVFRYADEHGYARPRSSRYAPPITDAFDARVTREPAPGAIRSRRPE